ncbi:MAG: PEGA domain-containing protein, partial [Fibrobacterota bacterium]
MSLGEKAEELVRAGNQYIAIDLTGLDYIYSDSINRFIRLNRIILDINGRILLIASHQKVLELLAKAGVQNFIKVCTSYDEVRRVSDVVASPAYRQDSPEQQAAPAEQKTTEPPRRQVVPENTKVVNRGPEQSAEATAFPTTEIPVVDNNKGFSFDDDGDDGIEENEFDEEKSLPVGVVIILFVVIALIAGGGSYVYLNRADFFGSPSPNTAREETGDKDAQETGETDTPAAGDTAESSTADTVSKENSTEQKSSPAEKEEPVRSVSSSKSNGNIPIKRSPKPEKRSRSSRSSSSGSSRRKKTSKPRKSTAIQITTTPKGATVRANGTILGTTPYTWEDPDVYGDVRITAKKDGYESESRTVQYFQKDLSVSLNLNKSVRKEPAKAKSLPSRKETTETAQKPQTEPKSRARKTQEKKP